MRGGLLESAVLGGWNMQALANEDALDRVALELLQPLTVIRLNAEELLHQFQKDNEDPATVDAAQALLRSIERMSQIVQVLRMGDPAAQATGEPERLGSAMHLVG
jgi:signal transduction histidine kinase